MISMKNKEKISVDVFRSIAAGRTGRVEFDGNWPVSLDLSDIEEDDVFTVDVNYFYEAKFWVGEIGSDAVITLDGVHGSYDKISGWIVNV